MKELLLLLILCIVAPLSNLRADGSFLLIQGNFGVGNTLETHLWEVVYQPGQLSTGQDLLDAVFGVPVDTGMEKQDAFGRTLPLYSAGTSSLGATYMYYNDFGAFILDSVTILNTTVEQVPDPISGSGWNYYLAGGTGSFIPPDYIPGSYQADVWTFSGDGSGTRILGDMSFDGWVFGEAYPNTAMIDGGDSTFAPTSENFGGATVIMVPEPGGMLLVLVGLAGLGLCRRRKQ